jgi:energy-coupling factor transport system permease protein
MDLMRSLPLGLYLDQPVTWLHRLDPRVKLAWVSAFLLLPMFSAPALRIGIVLLLVFLTISARIPLRVWKQQIGWLTLLCVYVGTLLLIFPDGLNANHQGRLPANETQFLQQPTTLPEPKLTKPWYNPFTQVAVKVPEIEPERLKQPTDYRYFIYKRSRLGISQRSLSLAIRVSTTLFTLLYSTSLLLLTTAAEEITAGLEELMAPLRKFKLPVTEVALTLTLALRFLPLVLEEFQNLIRSVRTRAINWKKLGARGSVQIWLLVAERLLENLLMRAEQMANAMQVRGFTSPNQHRVLWHQLRLRRSDWLAIGGLILFCLIRFVWGGDVV